MKLLTLIATVAFAFVANAAEPMAPPAPSEDKGAVVAPGDTAPVKHNKKHKMGKMHKMDKKTDATK